jgi:hypothetical protein
MRKSFLIVFLSSLVFNNAPVKAEISNFTENLPILAIASIPVGFFCYAAYKTFFSEEPSTNQEEFNKYEKLSTKKFLKTGNRILNSLYKKSESIRNLLKKIDLCIQNNDENLLAITINEINSLALIIPVHKFIEKCKTLNLAIQNKISRKYRKPKTIAALYTLKAKLDSIFNDLLKFRDLCTQKEEDQQSTNNFYSSTSPSDYCTDNWHNNYSHDYNTSSCLENNTCDTNKQEASTTSTQDIYDVLLSSHVN